MISTKKESLTPQLRKERIEKLREEHQEYFINNEIPDATYIPKMAYRPSGKDELHVSFFPSELEKGVDIYTEFVSIDYETEDPKRTLYLHRYNPHWREEYELVESSSGFQRHIVPVSELKIINDINTRRGKSSIFDIPDLPNPEQMTLPNPDEVLSHRSAIEALISIAETLKKIEQKIK